MPRPVPKPEPRKKKAPSRLGASEKRKAQSAVYRELLRPAFLAGVAAGQGRTVPHCQRCRMNVALEVHHKAGREGEALLDFDLWVALCPDCHRWVHANPEVAYAGGWLVSRNALRADLTEESEDAATEPRSTGPEQDDEGIGDVAEGP